MSRAAPSPDVFALGGELGALIRHHDWSSTSLGPLEAWPQSLKTAVGILLAARQPIWIGWGPDLLYLYNDPYQSIIGGKHPWALGRPAREVWHEIWDDISPLLATAQRGEQGTYSESQLLIMERNGYPEETYYTFSYSPIPAEDGSTGGIICANTDDTRRVIGERQLALLRDLAAATVDVRTVEDAVAGAVRALGGNDRDLPFALGYRCTHDGGAHLVATTGIPGGHALAPQRMEVGEDWPWPIGVLLDKGGGAQVVALNPALDVPCGPWARAPSQAVLLPLAGSGENGTAGVLVVGLNPYRLFDHGYRNFLELVAGQITLAISTAEGYEETCHRAEALAELDAAKTRFFSNVSHEFRTPLTLMLGPLQDALHEAGLAAPQRARLEIAQANAQRLLKLVNVLLDYTRVEAGRVTARFEATDLAAATADLASTFRSAMQGAGLRFAIECSPLPEAVYVDRGMWEKIVLNLISNAFKFTLEGEVSVQLQASQDGRHAVLRVADTGTGIPAAELPRLFERFHRIDGQRGRSYEGSGLGLALVQELVKQHGGTVAVDSVEGEGTAFTLSIPFGREHLPAAHIGDGDATAMDASRAGLYISEALRWLPGADVAPAAEMAGADFSGARIVVADDNADMRRYIGALLGQSAQVTLAADGEQALAALRAHKPDLLLTDS